MKTLRAKDIEKMAPAERKAKIGELRLELVRSRVAGKNSKLRTKEIKKAIARLLTVTNRARQSPSVTAH